MYFSAYLDFLFITYMDTLKLSPVQRVHNRGQGGDGHQGQNAQSKDSQWNVDLHPPDIILYPRVLLLLLYLSQTLHLGDTEQMLQAK